MKKKNPIFGYGGEQRPQPGRASITRDQGGHESWAEAILPADAEAGVLETPTSRRPLFFMIGATILALVILSTQLVNLQIVKGSYNLSLAEGNRIRQKVVRAPRGIIYDNSKTPLARNVASFDITVVPSLLPRDKTAREKLYTKVSQLTGVEMPTIAAKAETDCVDAEVRRKLPHEEAEAVCLFKAQPQLVAANLERDRALLFEEASPELTGFSADVNPIREYLDQGSLAAILGYTGRVSEKDLSNNDSYLPTDYIGKLGLERQYEEVLRGQNGSERTEVDAAGKPVKLLAARAAVPGSNIQLAVDMELQRQLASSISAQIGASATRKAAGVAINPKTGAILAAVNLPTYDNNLFARGINAQDYGELLNDKAQPLFNKVTSGAYPSGSIIKPLIGSAALQEGVVNSGTTVNDTGALEIVNKYDKNIKYTFRSYEPGGVGIVSMVKAIAESSNVYFFTIGGGYGNIAGLGVERLASYYKVDIAEQTAGRVPTPEFKKKATGEPWVLGDTYNISVGQGDLLVSPLQMAVATAAVANGGSVYKPYFVQAVMDANGKVSSTTQPEVVQKGFISPPNLALIRTGMRQVVTNGTACCKIEQEVPVAVAAKTGTAETDPEGKRKPHAWFSAFAPYDDPQIVIVVLIENSGEGAQHAAPAVRETLKWCFSRQGGCVR
jgi:penicillin-binding protein 2